ncbi:hybrid sensor histidine kinase/response regulator [Bacteriovoracaceae bacterium]|nr:hybrid sensor histidine kinase/response regulator [Bacteriovoracaceae bacterium]
MIQEKMALKQLTEQEIALKVNISIDQLKNWISEKCTIENSIVQNLSGILDIPFYNLLFLDDDPTYQKKWIDAEDAHTKQMEVNITNAKISMISTIAASLAHEINNPLAIIRGNLEIIRKQKKTMDALEEINTSIDKSVLRIKNVVECLNLYSTLNGNIQNFEHFDGNDIVKESIAYKRETMEKSRIGIVASYESAKIPMRGNSILFKQCIINFLDNSIEALVNSSSKRIEIFTKIEEDSLNLVIKDSGHGIHPDDINHVFEPFYSTKEPGKGLGLGLTVSYYIVKSMSGKMRLQEIENGTQLIVKIPLVQESVTEDEINNLDVSKLNFLIVDDEEDIREILLEYIDDLGPALVHQAKNGEQAYDLLTKNHYDLLVTDIRMPVMNGVELIKSLRDDPRFENLQIIVITGSVGEFFSKGKSEVREMVNSYLNKPFTEKEVKETIAKICTKSNQ